MTTRDQARAQAVKLIASRVSERDRAGRGDRADAEPFAASVLAELAAIGFRYVPALRPPGRADTPPATPEQARAYADTARRKITHPREQP